MPVDEKTVVEPSATTAVADNWDANGTPIVTKQKDSPPKPEESAASAQPTKQAKPEEKSAESGAAKQEPKPKDKLNRDERIKELTDARTAAETRAKELEERVRTLEAAAKPPAKAEAPKPKEPPKRPNPFTWTGTQEEFDKAMDAYEEHRDSLVAARTRQEQAQTEAQKSMSEMVKQTTVKHPDAAEKIKAATNDIVTKAPLFMQSFVNDSEVIGELLYTLSDATTLNNLLETAKTNPGKALRVLRDMELDIQKALSRPEEKKSEAKPEEKAPEPKPRAPKPPSEVGGRGAATEDAAIAAARDGNFAAFDAEQRSRLLRAS